jgi:hypothetical protein
MATSGQNSSSSVFPNCLHRSAAASLELTPKKLLLSRKDSLQTESLYAIQEGSLFTN